MASIPVFGQRVKRMRERRGLSVQELAERARTTYQTIWRIERGELKEPGIGVAQRIAHALGVGVDYLIGMFDEDVESELEPASLAVVVA
jgi:XRE family transcriptional regulator, master regulator for biofilm formation